mmetsp:Transcript_32327/g.43814  ORF Transcript_32327/g.43814 Transcript_32327/m.43814 type:complete len:84 (+) Transcript_32327:315-566(+)
MRLAAMISAWLGSHFSVAIVALWRVPACTGYKPALADDQIGGALQGACGPCERPSMALSAAIASRVYRAAAAVLRTPAQCWMK